MKNRMMIAATLLSMAASGQITHGTIVYERKVDVHRRMKDEQMKAMVPQFNTTQSQLLFDGNISLYRAMPKDEAPDPFEGSGGHGIMIRTAGGANSQLFRNTSTMLVTEYTELADRPYLVRDSIRQRPWKLADETKSILGMTCKKAEMINERGTPVVAWYTDRIPAAFGPENFGSLPGTVLQVDINNGEMVYNALSLSPDVDGKALREPTKGKDISRADFDKKLQEVYGSPGPGGGPVIRFRGQ